MRNRVIFA